LKHSSSSSNEETTNTQRICSPASPHFSFTTLKVKTNPSNLSGKNLADESSSSAANTNNTSESTGSKMGGIFMWPSFFSKLNSEPSSSKKLNKLAEKTELKTSTNSNAKNQNHLVKRNSINRLNTSNNDSSSSTSTTIKTNNNNNSTKVNRKMSDKHWAILLILVLVLIAFLTAFTVNTVYTSLYEVTPLVPSTDNNL
jgi:Fe2+ transport system protein B